MCCRSYFRSVTNPNVSVIPRAAPELAELPGHTFCSSRNTSVFSQQLQ